MKFVLIGCGLIARSHADAIRRIEDAELVAVCDNRLEAAVSMEEEYGCKAYEDAEKMLDEMKPDVAIICVPTFVHEQYVAMCADRKINVLCEKPLERHPDSCKKLIEEVQKNGIIFMTAQVVRFWAGYVDIKKMFDNGELGDIYMMHFRRVSSRAGQYGKWLFDPNLGGGAWGDMLVHDVDFLRYLAGPFAQVYSNAVKDETGCYNNVMANIIFKNGIHAVAETSFTQQTGYPFSFSVNIVGSKATLEYSYHAGATIADRSGSECKMKIWKKGIGLEEQNVEEYDAYQKQLEYYISCVKAGKQPEIITPDQSYDVICMIEAIKDSADKGQIISL